MDNLFKIGKSGQFYDPVSNSWVDGETVIYENPYFKTHANGSVTIKVAGKYKISGGIIRPESAQQADE